VDEIESSRQTTEAGYSSFFPKTEFFTVVRLLPIAPGMATMAPVVALTPLFQADFTAFP